MRRVLGLPLTDATLETWARNFVFTLEPLYLSADLAQRLEPRFLTMTRAEFGACSESLEYSDAYQPWNARGEFVALLTPSEFSSLEPDLRLELNAAQVSAKRGSVFPLETAREFGISQQFLERDAAGDSFLLRRNAWDALSQALQSDWLASYITEDGADCVASSLAMNIIERHRRALALTGWLPNSGPNCFATALSVIEPNETRAANIARLWLQTETFLRELERLGLHEGTFNANLKPGSVIAWRNAEGTLLHACAALSDGLVLNKNAQSWHAPRQILTLEAVLKSWEEDGLTLSVFARADS